MTSTPESFANFRSLHVPGRPLVLPNAWDVASARLIVAAGAKALATTSAGVAWSLGSPDGDRLDRTAAIAAVARIAAAVDVPVTADIEGGFAPDAAGVGETIRGIIGAGAVGVNLEDTDHTGAAPLRPVEEAAARIAAARAAADAEGVALYINGRIDTYLRGGDDVGAVVARAGAYLEAGATGIFVPGVTAPDLVAELVAKIPVPLNILAGPGAPSIDDLAALGVARVSVGASLARIAYTVARDAARELLTQGTYTGMENALDFGELNTLLS
jgi:2-methylisocitrate lyase-like PEP mutase family enzyme